MRHNGRMSNARNDLVLFSPSGIVAKATPVRKAARRLKALGFDVRVDESALLKQQRFAGDDDSRLGALQSPTAHREAETAKAHRG